MTRELLTGKRLRRDRQPNGFGQLYFSSLMSVFFRSLTYKDLTSNQNNGTIVNRPTFIPGVPLNEEVTRLYKNKVYLTQAQLAVLYFEVMLF